MDRLFIENKIKADIEQIFEKILKENNYKLSIKSTTRCGADISDSLENCFVNYINKNGSDNIINPKQAPKDKTKNPYDFCFNYQIQNFNDLIWGDIKAVNKNYNDSNPDLGTPEKVIKFILDGHFYILYVFFQYVNDGNTGVKFIEFSDSKYVHCQFLKDIHESVRINSKPQFQVNINKPEQYRTCEDFIKLFESKYNESLNRNILNWQLKKTRIKNSFEKIKNKLSIDK